MNNLATQERSASVALYEALDSISAELLHELNDSEQKLLTQRVPTLKLITKFFAKELIKETSKGIFRLACSGECSVDELIDMGQYDEVDRDVITSNTVHLTQTPQLRSLELLEYDEKQSTESILADMKVRGFTQPTIDDALYFGCAYPEEQRGRPLIFLHDPIIDHYGNKIILVLASDEDRRILLAHSFCNRDFMQLEWSSDCRFAAVH